MLTRHQIGLVISITIGVVIALFPLYADRVGKYLWSFNPSGSHEESHGFKITGIVSAVDPNTMQIVVDKTVIVVRGYWVVETSAGSERLWASEFLAKYIKPGMEITVECKAGPRWGRLASEIEGPGFKAHMEED